MGWKLPQDVHERLAVFEAPEDKTAGVIVMALSATTDAVTETLRPYTGKVAEDIIRAL